MTPPQFGNYVRRAEWVNLVMNLYLPRLIVCIFMGDRLQPWRLIQLFKNPPKLNFSFLVQTEQPFSQPVAPTRGMHSHDPLRAQKLMRLYGSCWPWIIGHTVVSPWTSFIQSFTFSCWHPFICYFVFPLPVPLLLCLLILHGFCLCACHRCSFSSPIKARFQWH